MVVNAPSIPQKLRDGIKANGSYFDNLLLNTWNYDFRRVQTGDRASCFSFLP